MNSVGKIYTKEDADKLYGPALQSVHIPVSELKIYMVKSINCLMFRCENGRFYVADDNRKILNSETVFSPDTVFTRFSISVIESLIEQGGGETAFMELRANDIVTITINSFTMETGVGCPPICS